MDKLALAKIVERQARKDCFDGVGRILLSDFKRGLETPITAQEIIEAWRELYPYFPIVQRTPNVILITFTKRQERRLVVNVE
jgi:hemoglobin-like flavoprotein